MENALKTPDIQQNPTAKAMVEEGKAKVETMIKSEKSELLSAKDKAVNEQTGAERAAKNTPKVE